MAFSNNMRKAVKRMSSCFNPTMQHRSMRIAHIAHNYKTRNRQFESVAMGMDGNHFGGIGRMNNARKVIGFDDGSNNMNDNVIDNEMEEQQDVDVDFLHCNEKLCKDNENKYDYLFPCYPSACT